MELVSNLREMGDALRANAERLLHDIQSIHSRMVSDLEKADPSWAPNAHPDAPDAGSAAGEPAPTEPTPAAAPTPARADDELDVPDFIPQR
jgi:hypothetical protein